MSVIIQTPDGKKTTPDDFKSAQTMFSEWKKFEEVKRNRPSFATNYGAASNVKSAGQTFIESEAYKRFISNKQNVSDAVPFTKATMTSLSVGGALLGDNAYSQQIVGSQITPLTIRDLLNVQTTQNNAITYMEQIGYTNAADIVPETTLKPESALTFEERTALVKVVAHWLPVTNQALADITGLQNYIDTQLLWGLGQAEEAQMLYGNGTGENLTGLMVHTGVQVAPVRLADDNFVDTIRRAITLATRFGDVPNGIVISPTDWETIELTKGNDDHYIVANIATGGEQRLWRVPVVVSSNIVAGDYLVGAFGTGATIFDREEKNIRISEHHENYFVRNMKAILAEQRLAFAIQKPVSFVRGTFATA